MPIPVGVLAVKGEEISVNGRTYQQHKSGPNDFFLIDVQRLDPIDRTTYLTNQLGHQYAETSANLTKYIKVINANRSILRETLENCYKVEKELSWRQKFINFFSSFFNHERQ